MVYIILSIKSFQFRPGLRYDVEEVSLTGNPSILQTVTNTFNLGSLLIYRIHVNENIHFFSVKYRWIYLHEKPDYKNAELQSSILSVS